jgi:hypothetical protein
LGYQALSENRVPRHEGLSSDQLIFNPSPSWQVLPSQLPNCFKPNLSCLTRESWAVRPPIIFVAYDEVMIRNLVTLLLQSQRGAPLFVVAQESLELSKKYPGTVDLVITDFVVFRLKGFNLCTRLRKERPGETLSEIVNKGILRCSKCESGWRHCVLWDHHYYKSPFLVPLLYSIR